MRVTTVTVKVRTDYPNHFTEKRDDGNLYNKDGFIIGTIENIEVVRTVVL